MDYDHIILSTVVSHYIAADSSNRYDFPSPDNISIADITYLA